MISATRVFHDGTTVDGIHLSPVFLVVITVLIIAIVAFVALKMIKSVLASAAATTRGWL